MPLLHRSQHRCKLYETRGRPCSAAQQRRSCPTMRLRLKPGRERPGARRRSVPARTAIAAAGAVALTALAACAGGGSPPPAAHPASAASAGGTGGANCKPGATHLTFWAWAAGYNLAVNQFNATHPDICVTLENDGATNVEYTKIQDAEKAGS